MTSGIYLIQFSSTLLKLTLFIIIHRYSHCIHASDACNQNPFLLFYYYYELHCHFSHFYFSPPLICASLNNQRRSGAIK